MSRQNKEARKREVAAGFSASRKERRAEAARRRKEEEELRLRQQANREAEGEA